MSKARLREEGFGQSHFRSSSAAQDEIRGFGRYVHMTLTSTPPILRAKLAAGFPHFELAVPVEVVERTNYLLCRFNIAKSRNFAGARKPPIESPENGYYTDSLCLPVAQSSSQKTDLLRRNLHRRMIEALILGELPLPVGTKLGVYCDSDFKTSSAVLRQLCPGKLEIVLQRADDYPANPLHRPAVLSAIEAALSDPTWKGSGLEFDRFQGQR